MLFYLLREEIYQDAHGNWVEEAAILVVVALVLTGELVHALCYWAGGLLFVGG